MPDSLVTLYQAEWCPFSSAVREVLTELGIDAVIHQVEPWPQQRDRLRALAGTDQIPVLQAEDGRIFRGTREITSRSASPGGSPPRTAAGSRITDPPANPTWRRSCSSISAAPEGSSRWNHGPPRKRPRW